jgi:hypothetical protein
MCLCSAVQCSSHRAKALPSRLGRLLLLPLPLLLGGRRALDRPQHGRFTDRRLVAAGRGPMLLLLLLLLLLCHWDGGLLQGSLLRRRGRCSAGYPGVLQRLARRWRRRGAWRQLVALRCAVRAAKWRERHVR